MESNKVPARSPEELSECNDRRKNPVKIAMSRPRCWPRTGPTQDAKSLELRVSREVQDSSLPTKHESPADRAPVEVVLVLVVVVNQGKESSRAREPASELTIAST